MVRAFAEQQPVTSIVNAIRALFTQEPVSGDIWVALAYHRKIAEAVWDRCSPSAIRDGLASSECLLIEPPSDPRVPSG